MCPKFVYVSNMSWQPIKCLYFYDSQSNAISPIPFQKRNRGARDNDIFFIVWLLGQNILKFQLKKKLLKHSFGFSRNLHEITTYFIQHFENQALLKKGQFLNFFLLIFYSVFSLSHSKLQYSCFLVKSSYYTDCNVMRKPNRTSQSTSLCIVVRRHLSTSNYFGRKKNTKHMKALSAFNIYLKGYFTKELLGNL